MISKIRAVGIVITVVLAWGCTGALPARQAAVTNGPSEALKVYLRGSLSISGKDPTTRMTAVSVNTHDGKTEEIVYVSGQGWCGSGGCTMLILEPEDLPSWCSET